MKDKKIKYFILFCIIMSILIGCAQLAGISNIRKPEDVKEPSEKRNLKFMTFNIRVGGGWKDPKTGPQSLGSSKQNLERIASAIKSVDPDVIALQEVRGYGQAKFIAETLNLNFSYVGHSNWWGLAILSKHKIVHATTKTIYMTRAGQICTISVNSKPSTFINVHYYLGSYRSQVRATMKIVEKIEGPVVLMGDFNRVSGHPDLIPINESQILVDSCKEVDTETSVTALIRGTLTHFQRNRIDYIFVDSHSFEVKDAGLVSAEYWDASDHIAYFTEVILKD